MPEGDAGTLGFTVPWMERLIDEGSRDPAVRRVAARLAGTPGDPIANAFEYVKRFPYVPDPLEYEMLQGAPFLLRGGVLGNGGSDCDCRVILLNSLLEAMGRKTRIVLIRAPEKPGFSHVYSEVLVRGAWVPLDTIFERFTVGMEVPNENGSKTPIMPKRDREKVSAAAGLIGLGFFLLGGL